MKPGQIKPLLIDMPKSNLKGACNIKSSPHCTNLGKKKRTRSIAEIY